ncbi:unannotated protein [freshwater metagenome]|uniref:Unannotated protein n=1 Tax=freshwater metagenome TaxID=449393 RepID=A0A6J6EHP1_9ZZZZ
MTRQLGKHRTDDCTFGWSSLGVDILGNVEHFIYGPDAELARFTVLVAEAGFEVNSVAGGVVVTSSQNQGHSDDGVLMWFESLALELGLSYDGHGTAVPEHQSDHWLPLAIQTSPFSERTGVTAGSSFALPLPDGRFAHALYLGEDSRGFLLLDVSTLVSAFPARSEAIDKAPRHYRQPILVWHTGFSAMPLETAGELASLPTEVLFRCAVGWPMPEEIELLERGYDVTHTDSPEGWNALLLAMAQAQVRLPGVEGYSIFSAQVDQEGVVQVIEDFAIQKYEDVPAVPMPWEPSRIEEVVSAVSGGPDLIAARDIVT